MTWTIDDDGAALSVATEGVEVARYVYAPGDAPLESPRPYLHPVRTLGGVVTTDYRPDDHVWHKGVSLALPVVGRHNLWGGPTYLRDRGYVQLENNGSQAHQGFSGAFAEDAGAGFTQELTWLAADGGVLAQEHRALAFARLPAPGVVGADGAAWAMTWSTTVINTSSEPLDLGSPTSKGRENAGYGGFFWRAAAPFRHGIVTMPDWIGGDEARGRRGRWAGYAGASPGAQASVVIVSHPDNPSGLGGDPEWFVRTEEYPALNPAPFFFREVTFPPGAALTFHYALAVTDVVLADPDAAARVAAGAALLLHRVETGQGIS